MTLGFKDNEIEIVVNANKAKYIEKLTALKQRAEAFEEGNKGKETLAIAIINIGNRIDPFAPTHAPLIKNLGLKPTPKGIGAYEDFYELTEEGEALNLNEYAAWIADTRNTKVYQDYKAWQMSPLEEGGQNLAEAAVPFKSRTHVIIASDFQGKPGLLMDQHLKSTKEDFEKLELLDGQANKDRKGRTNVTFYPLFYIDRVLDFFKKEMAVEDKYVF